MVYQNKSAINGPFVWYSDAIRRAPMFGFVDEFSERDLGAAAEFIRQHKCGAPLDIDNLPSISWIGKGREAQDNSKLPHILSVGGYFTVSSKVADVLRQFDLGSSLLVPVTLLKSDRETPFGGEYFIFHLSEKKYAFEPDVSQNFKYPLGGKMAPIMSGHAGYNGAVNSQTSDGDLLMNASAFDGADVWRDQRLNRSFMMTDDVMQALTAANLHKGIRAFRCPLVTLN